MTAMTFGHRLKELRQARGLNQSEVGFGRYSASYVSLLERGLRKPNPEVVRFLSDHLGVEPEQFMATDSGEPAPRTTSSPCSTWRRAMPGSTATTSWRWCTPRQAAMAAESAGRPDSWWSSTHLLSKALMTLERYDECHDLAVELSVHSVATQSPGWSSRL